MILYYYGIPECNNFEVAKWQNNQQQDSRNKDCHIPERIGNGLWSEIMMRRSVR